MGLSSSKSRTTSDPWKPAQPYIIKGLQQSSAVFDQQQPDLNKYGQMQRDEYARVAPGAEAGIIGGQKVINDTLSGKNLNGNPYISGIWDRVNQDTTNGVNGQFESSGRYGSGMHAEILARELASAHNNLLYQNYNNERTNQVNAVGQAAQYQTGAQGLLNNAAELPWIGVGALNGNVRQASNGYGTQTTTQNQAWGPILAQAAGNAAAAYAGKSDPRLKTNVVWVSTDPDGLDWYDFDYRQDMGIKLPTTRQRGVMAPQVAILRPWALGPTEDGFMSVYYGKLAQKEAA